MFCPLEVTNASQTQSTNTGCTCNFESEDQVTMYKHVMEVHDNTEVMQKWSIDRNWFLKVINYYNE